MAKKSLVPIELPGDPSAALEAAPKQYVDLRALDSNVVHNTGAESPAGPKTWVDTARFNANIGQGIAAAAQMNLRLALPLTGAANSYASHSSGTIQSDATASGVYYLTSASTQAAAFTLTTLQHFYAGQGTIGAGSTVTNQYGFFAAATLTGATNNYGFWGQIPAAAGNWNFYAQGTALNYMNGALLIGSATDTGEKLQVTGTSKYTGAAVFNSNVTTDGGFILINRVGDAASSQVYQDTDAGFASQNIYRVGGLLRWQMLRNNAAESGANAGSNWQFAAYDDAGASLGNVYTVVRATQVLSFTVGPTAPTAAAGTNTTQLATTAYAMSAAPNASYRTLMDCSGSHTAAKVAGTYAMGQGDPLAVSGTGTLYPIQTIYIAAADFPTVNSLTTKLRIRAQLHTNDVAPTGNFTFGLYPITRPAVSGGAGLCIYTLGTVVSGSNGATFTAPAADGPPTPFAVGADFAIPADGLYCIGVVTTATVATSSHLHLTAYLQQRNT